MGEYYDWINADRKEYICPSDFDLGNKLHESMGRGNAALCALRELLSKEWAGDHILFLGDEIIVPADAGNETLRMLYHQTVQAGYQNVHAYDAVIETYTNVSGLFKAAEDEVREEILFYLEDLRNERPIRRNEYGVDPIHPFEGLFLRNGKDYRYTINHTKRVCYSAEETRIIDEDQTDVICGDPLPVLMAYGRVAGIGAWVGDIIGVGDEIPEGYVVMKEIRLDR